jgi:hypothetical protein
MNLFKSSLLGLLISFSLVIPSASFATEANNQALVATVNLVNPRIVSQDNNNFKIAFGISNKEGLQAGVKYGIQLVPDSAKYIADEKVYEESLTLNENTTIKREITYGAPSNLSGSYTLYLLINNESSFPFAMNSLGKVKLSASTKGIQIMNDSCYLQVEGEKGSPHYALMQNVDISAEEKLKLTCTAVNETSSPMSAIPFFETRYFSSYGKVATQTGGDFTAVALGKNEKKTFSLVLPKGDAPGFYSMKVGLVSNGDSSNNLSVKYIISGTNATLHKLSLDKDYYKAGDKGEVSVIWSASAGNFPRSGLKGGNIPLVSIGLKIVSDKDRECITPIGEPLVRDFKNAENKIAFKTKATCSNPHVTATITDSSGKVLDEKDFIFKSADKDNSKPLSTSSVVLIIIAMLAILGIGLYMKKKNSNVTM